MNDLRLTFRKGDLLAIALVAVLAAGLLAAFFPRSPSDSQGVVQVYQDGQLIRELSLSQDEIFQISGDYSNTVEISGGKVAIVETNCPGGDCAHSGWISTPGRSIVCLPNRVEIRVTGAADVDFVVG